MVNPKEVSEVFAPDPRNCREILSWQFVRIVRGKYTGDLGLVEKIDTDSKGIIVYVVPRLNIRKKAKRARGMDEYGMEAGNDIDISSAKGRRAESRRGILRDMKDDQGRPVPRMFDPQEHPDAKKSPHVREGYTEYT